MRRLTLILVVALLAAACGDSADSTTTTAAPEATAATTQPPATTEPPATTQTPTTTTVEVAATEATTTTSAVSEEQLAAAAAVGDMAVGEELYGTRLLLRLACSSCHLLEDSPTAPTHAGLSAVAADRVDGMSAVDYLRQSIVDPGAFLVDGEWADPMPTEYSDVLSEDQINNLIAFLLTR